MWIIARGDESLIIWWGIEYLEICLEHKSSTLFFQHLCKLKSQERGILLQFQVWYIGFTPSMVTSNSLQNGIPKYMCIHGFADSEGKSCEKIYSSVRRYVADLVNVSPNDLKSKTTEDIISIGSFMEVLVLIQYVLVRKIFRMELYIQGKEHGWIILNSVENGPLFWPTVEQEDDTIRLKTYEELSNKEKL
ncbi:hypothetical protein Tco_0323729 [Tanacetum coccineum]